METFTSFSGCSDLESPARNFSWEIFAYTYLLVPQFTNFAGYVAESPIVIPNLCTSLLVLAAEHHLLSFLFKSIYEN